MSDGWTKTTCPYCGVGCGVLVRPSADGQAAEVRGDPDHPANFGRLCSKGTALGATLADEGRLLAPLVGRAPTDWTAALDLVARKFSEAIAQYGPDSVAFYVSGQLLTEDYYVANKLMKGYIGSANIDTNSRLCMASSVAGHKRAFGSDTVPGCYEDLELADLIVLVGSNLAWCHPVLYQRLAAARERRGTKVIVIDPRRTATCAIADLHLGIKAGSDVALFNGLLAHLARNNVIDETFVSQHTRNFESVLYVANQLPLDTIADLAALSSTDIRAFYDAFAGTERVVTVYSQGVNQSTTGTDKVNAIINCHLATGRIGKPGMGPFSVTGQPNAMGGREVGGLANMLAAHTELSDPEHRRIVRSFWKSPRIADKPGLKAVDLFRAVAAGKIKALWIMATNPAVSMPESDLVRHALKSCPFLVISEVERHTDTAAFAHVLLPSSGWGEKDGTVTNSERRISRQRAFRVAPGSARPDWWQIAQVATRMGFSDAFSWCAPVEIFAEYAALSGAENDGNRDLDLSRHRCIKGDTYDTLTPFQWPAKEHAATGGSERFFADGRFFTPDGRARFIETPVRSPADVPTAALPLVLNTGRIRDQWHTMTRTARAPRLASHVAEPFVEMHPDDAALLGIAPADLTVIANDLGSVIVRAVVSDRVARGSVFVPMHWSDQFASRARVDVLVRANVDDVSGQPELKHGAVRIERFGASWYAFGAAIDAPAKFDAEYWAMMPAKGGWRIELASRQTPPDGMILLSRLWKQYSDAEILSYRDPVRREFRFAAYDGQRLLAALFIAASPVLCDREHVISLLGEPAGAGLDRIRILSGRPGGEQPDRGPTICACLGVGRNQIIAAIAGTHGRVCTVDTIGILTGAGTNCGSCRAEILGLIHATPEAKAS